MALPVYSGLLGKKCLRIDDNSSSLKSLIPPLASITALSGIIQPVRPGSQIQFGVATARDRIIVLRHRLIIIGIIVLFFRVV
jgi:hypothetical protein